jgi:uncharacterized protein
MRTLTAGANPFARCLRQRNRYSVLILGRRLAWLRHLVVRHRGPIVRREIVAGLLRVLTYPRFRLAAAEREDPRLPACRSRRPRTSRSSARLPIACRAGNDTDLPRLALVSRADLPVSGDADVTVLASARTVVSPATLRQLLDSTTFSAVEPTSGVSAQNLA